MAERVFLSRKDDNKIGSFEYGLGLLNIDVSKEAWELVKSPKRIHEYDPDQKKQYLLEVCAWIHERRHYLDTFGTIAGISVYASRLACLSRFIKVSIDLKHKGVTWQLPIEKWVTDESCPKEVKDLRRFLISYGISTDFFFGNFEPQTIPGHMPEAWLMMPNSENLPGMPMFPFSLSVGAPHGDISVLFPIGFEALLEGAAQAVSRNLVDTLFPDLNRDILVDQIIVLHREDHEPEPSREEWAKMVSLYNATDLLISKYLRNQGVHEFPRALVLKLTDIALSSGVISIEDISDSTTMTRIDSAAIVFVDMLESLSVDQLKNNDFDYPEHIDALYVRLLEKIRQGGDWDTVLDHESIYNAPHVWQSFLAQNLTKPLLERRIETKHESMYGKEHVTQIFDRNLPCVQVMNGQLRFENIPEPVQRSWAQQMILSEIAQQIFSNEEVILCPRAHRMLPGMESLDLSGGKCRRNERQGCGSWRAGRELLLPRCVFSSALSALSVVTDNDIVQE
ncbi:hypothetical protein BA896_020365 [Janthinobacterium lividum]|uniref:Uncharacterized protein n=1 Tax=Janthinobacterium lividum TaxID=29581 RepID=A0A1E8PK01_9BURK|nr:hypothetical protein BA896_020365 [Janthinobacterium lividum]